MPLPDLKAQKALFYDIGWPFLSESTPPPPPPQKKYLQGKERPISSHRASFLPGGSCAPDQTTP